MELSGGKTRVLEVGDTLHDSPELQSYDEKQEVQDLSLAVSLPKPRGLFWLQDREGAQHVSLREGGRPVHPPQQGEAESHHPGNQGEHGEGGTTHSGEAHLQLRQAHLENLGPIPWNFPQNL